MRSTKVRIGYIGSINLGQPVWRFIEIIAPFLRASENLQLSIAGEGPMLATLKNRIKELVPEEKCEVFPSLPEEDALKLAGNLDLGLAFYSEAKTWRGVTLGDSMKIRLYLRAGTPVATNLPDIGALLEVRGAGKLLDLNRPQEIIEFITRLTLNRNSLRAFKNAAREAGRELPDWDEIGSMLIGVLRERRKLP